MKTITTTREYDDEGRLVKETVMETVTPDYDTATYRCTCGTTAGCPVHQGYKWWTYPTTVSIGSTVCDASIYRTAVNLP